jgi:hypothetical protein
MKKIKGLLLASILFTILILGLAYNANAVIHSMCIAIKGNTNNHIYLNCIPSMGLIGPWEKIVFLNATDKAPATAVYMGRIWVAWKGLDKKIYFNFSDEYGKFNTPNAGPGFKLTDGFTDDSPALAFFNNRLYLAVKGLNNVIYIRYVTGYYNGGTWSSWQSVPGATQNSPALTVVDTGGNPRLYMAVRGMNNNVYVNSMNTNGVWGGWADYGGQIDDAPALAWHNSYLYVAVKNFWFIYVRRHYLSTHLGLLYPWNWVPGLTNVSPGIAVQSLPYNELIMSAKGVFDNKIYLSWLVLNPYAWGNWQSILEPGLTTDSPAMTAFP